jgi:hypothetical protein
MSFLSGIRGWPLWMSIGLRNKVSGEMIHACSLGRIMAD